MSQARHILALNEFYHPDICASAVVATDHLSKIARLRPDWRITVIAGNRAWNDPDMIYPPREEHEGVSIIRAARPSLGRRSLLARGMGFFVLGVNTIRAAKHLPKVDLVIGTTAPPQGGYMAMKIASRAKCPCIYKVLDLYPDCAATLGRTREGGFLHQRWLKRDTKVMIGAAQVVTICDAMRERIVETRSLTASRVTAIHDGFDASKLRWTGENSFAKRHNPQSRFVVQYAGNMGLSHPFDTIVSAARVMRGDPDISFQFIGDGPSRRALADDLPPGAQLLDFQPPQMLGQVLATADVCLISQHQAMFDQALPYKVYAILAAGKPCIFIGNGKSEIAQWLTTSGAGLHVDQGDSDGLIRAIGELKRNTSRRHELGLAAKRLFDERFDSHRSVQKWVELIEGALAAPSHR
jgi:glycosyltransferase involved in cell wall biosynthesis